MVKLNLVPKWELQVQPKFISIAVWNNTLHSFLKFIGMSQWFPWKILRKNPHCLWLTFYVSWYENGVNSLIASFPLLNCSGNNDGTKLWPQDAALLVVCWQYLPRADMWCRVWYPSLLGFSSIHLRCCGLDIHTEAELSTFWGTLGKRLQ